jgi:hypothetical protein
MLTNLICNTTDVIAGTREANSDRQIISGVCIKEANMAHKLTAGHGTMLLGHGHVVCRMAQERQVPNEAIFAVNHGCVNYYGQ